MGNIEMELIMSHLIDVLVFCRGEKVEDEGEDEQEDDEDEALDYF